RRAQVRAADALADPAVRDRARALLRDPLLVQLVVEERAVVGDEDETGNAVVRRGPQRRRPHQEIAVTDDGHGEPAGAFQSERCAHRDAKPRADSASALGADVIERTPKVAVGSVPAARPARDADVDTLRAR